MGSFTAFVSFPEAAVLQCRFSEIRGLRALALDLGSVRVDGHFFLDSNEVFELKY